MGIFDFFKKNKKNSEVTKVVDSDNNELEQNNADSDDSKSGMFDFDAMSRQMFYRYEAAYRHQQIVLPRFKAETGIPVGDILKQILPDVVSQITGMSVLHTVQMNGIETKHQHFTNAEEALAYDLFWNIFYKNEKDNDIYPIAGTNITLTIRTKGENIPPYIVMFARGIATGFETIYIRISLMIPANVNEDDLRTSKSNSVPTMTSFLIACDKKDNPKQYEEYEEAEKRVLDCLKLEKPLRDDIDRELFYGFREFKPYFHYFDYGKWLYSQERYIDACGEFMRAFKYLRANPNENKEVYYEICNLIAKCLMHHNHYETAGYFYSLAYSGGAVNEEEYINFLIAIADIRSIDVLCSNLIKKYGNDIEKWPQDAQGKYNRVFYLYKKNCDEDKERSDKVAFYSDSGFGLVLMRMLDIKENQIMGMNVISPDDNLSTFIEKEQFWNESLYKYLIPGTTIVLPYSKACYATGNKEDMSILSHASSIVIYIDSAKAAEKLVRVNIMIPNFNTNDDKHEFSEINTPLGISFIISSVDEPKLEGEGNLNAVYDYAIKCLKQNRCYEAHMAFLMIYKKLSVKRLILSDEEKELFYETSYRLGYCMEELQNHEKALFYLEQARMSGIDTHEQEYINALVNSRDPRALAVIRDVKSKGYDGDPESDAYKYHYAFLNRREAYVLIDLGMYDEAETLLKEMLNEPMSKDFAEGELNFVRQMKQQ
jgi:tetratricopeptide (TPR) repeat protein